MSNSYTEWRYQRACERKVSYESIGDASRAIIRLRHRYDRRLIPYQCQFCGLWHLTHQPPKAPHQQ